MSGRAPRGRMEVADDGDLYGQLEQLEHSLRRLAELGVRESTLVALFRSATGAGRGELTSRVDRIIAHTKGASQKKRSKP